MTFPRWQLHRGYWKKGVRENTIEAFQEAKNVGCEMVELDVQLSRDGIPYVFHDFTLKRFFHIDEAFNKQRSEELEGLNIPALKDVLVSEDVPSFLNIEIKSIDLFSFQLSKKVCDVIREFGESKTILISSFNPMCLFWVRQLLPDFPRALIVGSSSDLLSWKFPMSMKIAAPHYINAKYVLIDEEKSRDRLLGFKKPIMVWTVNDEEKAQLYLTRGARSVISDLPPISKL